MYYITDNVKNNISLNFEIIAVVSNLLQLTKLIGIEFLTILLSACSLFAPQKVIIGLYDYNSRLSALEGIEIQHVFVGWNNYDTKYTSEQLDKIRDSGKNILITLEPWPIFSSNSDSSQLFDDIRAGRYDEKVNLMCDNLAKYPDVIIRWGHEMDMPSGRYTWSGGNPQKYIESYKHFVDTCRKRAEQVKYMWSPAGNKNLKEYYPGESYVDYVGLSIYYYPDWQKDYGSTFFDLLSSKYELVKNYKKKIIIAELGVYGSEEMQKKWLEGATKSFNRFPLLDGLVYFNSTDHPGVWGDLPTPDWQISESTLKILTGREEN
ncbi:beta-mannosidase [Candidatus Shapirobacteria bacterium]|nr:beta-mannosidase [Candidatus Shapirobacteria bacterium]